MNTTPDPDSTIDLVCDLTRVVDAKRARPGFDALHGNHPADRIESC